MTTINERISELCAKRGITGYAIAKKSGLSERYVHRILRGERNPSYDTIHQIIASMRKLGATKGELSRAMLGSIK